MISLIYKEYNTELLSLSKNLYGVLLHYFFLLKRKLEVLLWVELDELIQVKEAT